MAHRTAAATVTLTLPAALRAHAHLAIIGAPGAGKTTALKWLALAYARRQVKEPLARPQTSGFIRG